MPNAKRKGGGGGNGTVGGWMQSQSAGSSHSSPASSVKSSNMGGNDYINSANHSSFPQQGMPQQSFQSNSTGGDNRMMGHPNQHHMQLPQQPSPTQNQYGNSPNTQFYSQYGQHPQMIQQQQQQQQQSQPHHQQQQQFSPQQQRLPAVQDGIHNQQQQFFHQSPPNAAAPNNAPTGPYGYPAGALPSQSNTGLDGGADTGYGGGSWVSAVPTSSFVSSEGSAITKSQNYPRQQIHQNHSLQNVNNEQQQQQFPVGGISGGGGIHYQSQQQQQQHQLHQTHPQAVQQPPFNRNIIQPKYDQALEEDDEDGDENDDENGDGDSKKRQPHQKGASEFVKKLFKMLDDTSYSSIVSWGPMGDSFIVRDMNDFTKFVLPRHFRHSNFASFVRQLNKYDFHKVNKKGADGQSLLLGVDQQWEFKHPAFMKGREDMLDRVKRKALPMKKGGKKGTKDSPRDDSPGMPGLTDAAEKGAQEYSQLKDQVATLTASQDQMTNHINSLTKQYQAVIGEMLTFQKNMVQQDQLMQNLIQYLMNLEADRKIDTMPLAPQISDSTRPHLENGGAFVTSTDAEKLVSSFSDVAKESFNQMSQIAQRAAMNGSIATSSVASTGTIGEGTSTVGTSVQRRMSDDGQLSPKSSLATPSNMAMPSPSMEKGKEREMSEGQQGKDASSIFLHPPHLEVDNSSSNDLFNAAANAINNPTLAGFEDVGLRVFTVGTLQPRQENVDASPEELQAALSRNPPGAKGSEEGNRPFGISVPDLEQLPAKMPRVDGRNTSANPTPRPGEENNNEAGTPSEGGSNMLRIRRSTYVPGWAVPPKVLVVDDDDVCRKLGSKFLQVFGCAIDVAVDGVTAVNKMNLEKYDLVLMDIVMPNLDGVSATSLIREFDARTPIISMTSNSGPQELLSYMSSGMTDVLPKPFTKEGLLNMLEKHLIHLKTVQKMDEIPKALGLPPISGDLMQNVLSATAASANSINLGGSSSEGANPMAAMMGNGPEALRQSQEASGTDGTANQNNGGFDENGEGLVNPLAGMGFSDEEYISMLQNLIAAGAVSDTNKGETADTVANVMGVTRGEGSIAANMPRSKESTPTSGLTTRGSMLPPTTGGTRKRPNENGGIESAEVKKSRFTEMSSI